MAQKKISVLIDVVVDNANRSLSSFKKSVQDADGTVGKFKAGVSGAFDQIKANAGNLAMAGGAAIVAFGAKSVAAFQETALEAGRMSDALGVPVDSMSRLVEVAGDLSIESKTLETSLGRMNTTAGKTPQAFDDIGAAIARNEDGTMNVQQTFLNVVDALNAMPDAGQRAAAAQKIFGKGWKDMAELIGQGSDTITASMKGVSEAQAISPEEVKKAREYKAAMEDLKDSINRITLSVGEGLVPVLESAASSTAGMLNVLEKLGLLDLAAKFQDWTSASGNYNRFIGVARQETDLFGREVNKVTQAQFDAIQAAKADGASKAELAALVNGFTAAEQEASAATDKWTLAAEDSTGASEKLTAAYDEQIAALREQLAALDAANVATMESRDSSLAYRNQVADTTAAIAAGTLVQLDSKRSDEEKAQSARDVEAAVYAQADAAVQMAIDTAAAEGKTLTATETDRIYRAELDKLAANLTGPTRAAIDAHTAALDRIPRSITTVVTTKYGSLGGSDYTQPGFGTSGYGGKDGDPTTPFHSGGIAGGMSFAGLRDDEVPAVLKKGEAVLTQGQQAAVGGGMDPAAWGRMAADAFARRMQQNGRVA